MAGFWLLLKFVAVGGAVGFAALLASPLLIWTVAIWLLVWFLRKR